MFLNILINLFKGSNVVILRSLMNITNMFTYFFLYDFNFNTKFMDIKIYVKFEQCYIYKQDYVASFFIFTFYFVNFRF